MQRRILIVDDHDDLSSALTEVFSKSGYYVKTTESREEALDLDKVDAFDLVISDLDGDIAFPKDDAEQAEDLCLPENDPEEYNRSSVKAFKVCATNFRREDFNEDELKNLFETVLNYKAQFVDKMQAVQQIREKIEFVFPSAISLMHSILEYLMKRVEKVGVINPESSNLFIALDEAFVNAVKHGNKFDANKIVKVSAEVSTKEARFTVEDQGDGFDVESIPDPRNPDNLFKSSGRGVLFIYNIMDEVRYNERGNRLEMIKKSDKFKESEFQIS
ncbi:MAG: Anti-sigma regulatory factor (Ser/Thr protein kinase) [Acidobacteria bacterium]|jgi:serine/threonine-protein kinase RsbW|nr:Anti-sigma regulatory factor (Ser/Thr protein kinase) [Acidobacteriota bacterium]